MSYLAILRRFNLNVRLFMISTAIMGFTSFGGIFAALGNLYLLRMGYGTQFIGTMNAVGALIMVMACFLSSTLEHRFGSRNLTMVGLSIITFASFLLQAAVFIPADLRSVYILVANSFNSIGLGFFLVNSQPFLAASTTTIERGHAFSIQSALWPISGFAGSLVGGMLPGIISQVTGISMEAPGAYQMTLWISTVISAFALLFMLPTRQPVQTQVDETSPENTLKNPAPAISSTRLFPGFTPYHIIILISIVVAVQMAGEGSVRTFGNVYLDDGLNLPTTWIGLILGFSQLFAGLAALLTPVFTSRLGNANTYVFFTIGISLCMLPLIFIPTWYGAALGYTGAIMMVQIARPALMTIQMESVASQYRAPMAAFTTMAASLSMGLVGLLGGFMIPTLGYPAFFLTTAWLTGLAALGFWSVLRIISSLPVRLRQYNSATSENSR
jgi:MFS family permease